MSEADRFAAKRLASVSDVREVSALEVIRGASLDVSTLPEGLKPTMAAVLVWVEKPDGTADIIRYQGGPDATRFGITHLLTEGLREHLKAGDL